MQVNIPFVPWILWVLHVCHVCPWVVSKNGRPTLLSGDFQGPQIIKRPLGPILFPNPTPIFESLKGVPCPRGSPWNHPWPFQQPLKNRTIFGSFPQIVVGSATLGWWWSIYLVSNIWVFPKIGVPQNGLFISWKTLLKWMIWEYHYFWKHQYVHVLRKGFLL